jgi:hypothetical protein
MACIIYIYIYDDKLPLIFFKTQMIYPRNLNKLINRFKKQKPTRIKKLLKFRSE